MELNRQNNLQVGFDPRNILSRLSRSLYIKRRKKEVINTDQEMERNELLQSIRDVYDEWVNANRNFEYAEDEASVDYYTYRIKACEVRYDYFLKKAKQKGIDAGKMV